MGGRDTVNLLLVKSTDFGGTGPLSNMYMGPTDSTTEVGEGESIRQLDFNMSNSVVRKGDKLPEVSGSCLFSYPYSKHMHAQPSWSRWLPALAQAYSVAVGLLELTLCQSLLPLGNACVLAPAPCLCLPDTSMGRYSCWAIAFHWMETCMSPIFCAARVRSGSPGG